MNRTLTAVLGVFLGMGMLMGFAGPVAAQENTANATVEQGQANTQANEQSAVISTEKKADTTVNQSNTQVSDQQQTGVANTTADQGITVDATVSVEQPKRVTQPEQPRNGSVL